MLNAFRLAAAAGCLSVVACPFAAPPHYSGPIVAGEIEAPTRLETSGLATSMRSPDVLWLHDDSGGAASLYAITTKGKSVGTLHLRGVKNEDWEDIASYQQDGKAWLLIADVGDNDAKRSTVQLHVVEEPPRDQLSPTTELRVRPARTLTLRYEDGPRDCESVAVDPVEGAIYLLSKRDDPPRLYRVPLAAPETGVQVARFVRTVKGVVGPVAVDSMLKHVVGKKFSWPTGMDFSLDGRAAVVLTYGEPLVFSRAPGETWATAFGRAPLRLPFPGLPQAEAVCFSNDGRTIFVASEMTRTFARYDRETK
ncbi:MAG: hypothetical protein ABIQ12_04755 [Opitutaceae bacterium]